MEKSERRKTADEIGINPPKEAHATAVLNNIGNGMMIGGALPFAYNLYHDVITKKNVAPDKLARTKWGLAFVGGGAIVGAVMGQAEGRRLQIYRHRVSEKIVEQDERIAELEAQSQRWKDREHARKNSPEMAEVTR